MNGETQRLVNLLVLPLRRWLQNLPRLLQEAHCRGLAEPMIEHVRDDQALQIKDCSRWRTGEGADPRCAASMATTRSAAAI